MTAPALVALDVDTKLLHSELLGIARGNVWVRERERNLLVAFDLATGAERFRYEQARRAHVLPDVVLSEDGGAVTAIDAASGAARALGQRQASAVLGVTRHAFFAGDSHAYARESAFAMSFVDGESHEIELGAVPLPGMAERGHEAAVRLADRRVAVLDAREGAFLVERLVALDAVLDAVLAPIATTSGLAVPFVEATPQGPRTRLLSLSDRPTRAVEFDLIAVDVRASGSLVAASDGNRTIVDGGGVRVELPGALEGVAGSLALTTHGDLAYVAHFADGVAARIAFRCPPGTDEARLDERTIVFRTGSRLVIVDLGATQFKGTSAVELAMETRAILETAIVTFVSPRGISFKSERYGGLNAKLSDVTGWAKGDRVHLRETPDVARSRVVHNFARLAPDAPTASVTRSILAAPENAFPEPTTARVIDVARMHASLGALGVPMAGLLEKLMRAHAEPSFAERFARATGLALLEEAVAASRSKRVRFARTSSAHVAFELGVDDGTVIGRSQRSGFSFLEGIDLDTFLAHRLWNRREIVASSVSLVAQELGVQPRAEPRSRWATGALLDELLPLRAPIDFDVLEARLALPLGPTLRAFVEMAYRAHPEAPSEAFAHSLVYLPWIDPVGPAAEAIRAPGMTPRDVRPFAETGGDLTHFGFLLDGSSAPADERPIVMIIKDSPAASIVAPNLASFLGLLTSFLAEDIDRKRNDTPHVPNEEPVAGAASTEFAWTAEPSTGRWSDTRSYEAARWIGMIPGVVRAERMGDVTTAIADHKFSYL
ncbi:MAG: hypothetical protein QM820_63520 [Minicystis sp.]